MKQKNTKKNTPEDSKPGPSYSLIFTLSRQDDFVTLQDALNRLSPKYYSLIHEIILFAPSRIEINNEANPVKTIKFNRNPSRNHFQNDTGNLHRTCLINIQDTTNGPNLNDLLSQHSEEVLKKPITRVITSEHINPSQCRPAPVLYIPYSLIHFYYPYVIHEGVFNWWLFTQFTSKNSIDAQNITIQNIRAYESPGRTIKRRLAYFNAWYLAIPFDVLRKRNKKPSYLTDLPVWRFLFLCSAILFLGLMISMSASVGISGDEKVNYHHAKAVFDYFASGGENQAALHTPKTKLKYYGQSFDNFTYLFNKVFNIEKEYQSRHILNALVGWIGLLFAGLTAMLIGGWRAGFFTLLFLFLSPRYLGHSFNNPKDIPFAAAYIMFMYFAVRMLKYYPIKLKINLSGIAIAIAFAISVRIGGLLLVAYLFLFYGLFLMLSYTSWIEDINARVQRANLTHFLWMAIASFAAYILGIIFWPFALEAPFKNPIESLGIMTNFMASIKQVFSGQMYWSNTLPWFYAPKYILVTTPIVVMVFVLLYLFYGSIKQNTIQRFLSLLVLFSFIFPIAYIIYKNSNVYGGWRHVLFSYPPATILAGIGISILLSSTGKKRIPFFLIAGILIAGFFQPVKHYLTNHPNTYIYFNSFAGGNRGALGNYEMDYYFNSLKQGADWVKENILDDEPQKSIILASNHADILGTYFRDYDSVKINYISYYQAGDVDWDYAVVANAYLSPFQLKEGLWPPKSTVHTITINKDVPICAIIKREQKDDLRGAILVKDEKYVEAIPYLRRALLNDSTNTAATVNISRALIDVGKYEMAISILKKGLETYPDYDKILNILGIAYLKIQDHSNAVTCFKRIIKVSPNFVSAYYNLGLAYIQMNKDTAALQEFQKALRINPRYKKAYLMIAKLLEKHGEKEQAEQYRNIANSL